MFKPSVLLENIRAFNAYRSPYTLRDVWPVGRRSAVLVLLFIGTQGELRVLLTKRSRSLRSFSGHVSFPGGKADEGEEVPEQVARREAAEEIGLPQDPHRLRDEFGMEVENVLTEMPCYMSRTLLSVKPVVCLLKNKGPNRGDTEPLNGSRFVAKLNPGETSSLFSVPLLDLAPHHLRPAGMPEYIHEQEQSLEWGGLPWVVRHLHYPVENPGEVPWLQAVEDISSTDEDHTHEGIACRDLWGLTAKVIGDLASVATRLVTAADTVAAGDPHVTLGHEDLIYGLHRLAGEMQPARSPWESALIAAKRGVRYADKIPPTYMQELESRGITY